MAAILLFGVTIFALKAYGLNCDADNAPYLYATSRPSALCVVSSAANNECWTYLSDPNDSANIWGASPEPGSASTSYKVVNNAVTVQFSRSQLYANVTVTGNVRCGNELYSFNFTPQYVDYSAVGESWITVGDNAEYIVMGIIALAAIMGTIYFIRWVIA